jgi:hypothetical protein
MINVNAFKKAVNQPELIRAAKTVFMAMAYAETIRPTVEGYQKTILAEMQARPEQRWIDRGVEKDEPILNPERAYLLNDTDSAVYFRRLDEEKEKAGFHGLESGYCPLLIAEDLVRKAEHALVDLMEPLTGISHQAIFCAPNALENYRKYLKLTLGLFAPLIK